MGGSVKVPESGAERIEIVKTFYERLLDRGDWEGAAELLSEALVVYEAESLPFGGVHRGREGLKALLGRLTDCWQDLKIECKGYTAGEGRVIALLEIRARARATGKSICMPIVEVSEFENGKISVIRPVYWDTKALCEALGAS